MRRAGFVDGIQPPLGRQRLAPRIILILDPLPARQARGRDLIVQHDRGVRQIVEQGFKAGMEEGQPVLHPRPAATLADGGVERIVPGRPELRQVAGPETGDGGRVEQESVGKQLVRRRVRVCPGAGRDQQLQCQRPAIWRQAQPDPLLHW